MAGASGFVWLPPLHHGSTGQHYAEPASEEELPSKQRFKTRAVGMGR